MDKNTSTINNSSSILRSPQDTHNKFDKHLSKNENDLFTLISRSILCVSSNTGAGIQRLWLEIKDRSRQATQSPNLNKEQSKDEYNRQEEDSYDINEVFFYPINY